VIKGSSKSTKMWFLHVRVKPPRYLVRQRLQELTSQVSPLNEIKFTNKIVMIKLAIFKEKSEYLNWLQVVLSEFAFLVHYSNCSHL
jgi:hypothetical protein